METATLEGIEMKSYTVSRIVERKATEAGALDGFECKCSCGLVMRSSLRSLLEQDVAAHAAYHTRRGDVVDQGAYEVKCDECKTTLRRTDSVAESAAGGTCDRCRREQRVEAAYADLKLRDRLTPGRTPWQRLKAEAEAIVAREEGDTFSPKVERVIDEARSAFVWGINDAATRRAAVAELARSFGFEVSDAGTVELEAAAAELGIEL